MTDNKRPSRPPPSAPPQSLPPTDDERFMDVALVHAKGGQPSPNPHVGAVVVKDGQVVGAGFHERAGAEHAEVAAIRAAGDLAKGATLYVTLEPCNHHGRTPPCTDAILAAKLSRVVIGCLDPNPHVEGGGAEALRAANVEVVVGVREAQAQKTIAPWVKFVTVGLPYVSLKLALSLDGRIATRSGASRWVTGPDARAKVHLLRSRSDGCAVGIGTALADDPRLTVRDVAGASPVRIIFDTNLRLPTNSRLAQTAKDIPTWLICGVDASPATEVELAAMGVECMRVPLASEGRVEVAAALRLLASRGIVSLMVEGGAELAGSLLASRFADELHVFLAPILLGPRGRPGAVDWAGPDTPQQAPRIASPSWELVGEDAYVHGQIAYPT
jgi:diaminohydroxyphosphoribosylaminopyrimidine deaminase/5-amino-6-(5-phosphoribosylamino)uracil reductase